MKIMHNGEKRTIATFGQLKDTIIKPWGLEMLELVQRAHREEELMECFNEIFSDYKYSLIEVEDYLMFEMCNESRWADLWE